MTKRNPMTKLPEGIDPQYADFYLAQSKTNWENVSGGPRPCQTCKHYQNLTNARWPLDVCFHPNYAERGTTQLRQLIGLNATAARLARGPHDCGQTGALWEAK